MVVLDASALLAYLFHEAGAERVEEALPNSLMSTVNLAEVISRFERDGHNTEHLDMLRRRNEIDWIPFSMAHAIDAGQLISRTRHLGLSLGDRACLALAKECSLPAMTADRQWAGLEIGIEIQLIC